MHNQPRLFTLGYATVIEHLYYRSSWISQPSTYVSQQPGELPVHSNNKLPPAVSLLDYTDGGQFNKYGISGIIRAKGRQPFISSPRRKNLWPDWVNFVQVPQLFNAQSFHGEMLISHRVVKNSFWTGPLKTLTPRLVPLAVLWCINKPHLGCHYFNGFPY